MLLTPEDLSLLAVKSPRNSPLPSQLIGQLKRKKLNTKKLDERVSHCKEYNDTKRKKPENVYYLNFIIDRNDFKVLCDSNRKVIVKRDDNKRYFLYENDNNRAIFIDNSVYNYRFIEKTGNQYVIDSNKVLEKILKEYILKKHKDLFENVGKTTFEKEDSALSEDIALSEDSALSEDIALSEDSALSEEAEKRRLKYQYLFLQVIRSRTPISRTL